MESMDERDVPRWVNEPGADLKGAGPNRIAQSAYAQATSDLAFHINRATLPEKP